jgi:DNA invertase Pin-like site-specific DNA recombinase
MKYFVYCRKSSDREDRQVLGPEAQKRLLLEYAERHRLPTAGVYVEHQTAYKTGRPLFNEMLACLEAGEADAILTYHLTRLARNSYDGGRLIYMMDEGIVAQIATMEKSYTNNSDDKFLMQIHFAMAKKSSDDTSQFVCRDIESKLLKGEYPGMVPRGYLNITRDGHIAKGRDSKEKYLHLLGLGRPLRREEIDPIDGPRIRRLYEEASLGRTTILKLRRLSHQLGLRAPKTGAMLSKTAILNILTDPYYHGAIEYGGKLYTENIQHEPLVSKDLFDQVQGCLSRRGRYRKHCFTFGGCFLKCGACGGTVTAERHKGHVYYHCTRARDRCPEPTWLREEVIEGKALALLDRIRVPQVFLDYALGKLRKAHAHQTRLAQGTRLKVQTRANTCQQELDALLRLKISARNADESLLSEEEYLRQKAALREELEAARQELASIDAHAETWVDDCERFFSFSQWAGRRFRDAPAVERKSLLHLVCQNLTLSGGTVLAEYREGYSELVLFSLAGKEAEFPSEPALVASESEKYVNSEEWLGTLAAIRTCMAIKKCA